MITPTKKKKTVTPKGPKPTTRTFVGFRVRQRDANGQEFFSFVATAKDVLSWSSVSRVAELKGGIQRRLHEGRVKAIRRYFDSNQANTIPTSAIIAFKPGVAKFTKLTLPGESLAQGVEWGRLEFKVDPDPHKKPAFIVDGQHRLYGISKLDGEVPVLLSALLDADSNEQAFQFVVINNKASKVPPDLVKALIVDFDESKLNDRLKAVRIRLGDAAGLVAFVDDDPESPFFHLVDWERRRGDGTPAIKPAAIEYSLSYIRRRLLTIDEGDDDSILTFFSAMWWGIRDAYPSLWIEPDNNLFSNAGFKALSEHVVDELDTLASSDFLDIESEAEVRKIAKKLASQIALEFWTATWALKSLDTSAGKDILREDLRRIRQNAKSDEQWSKDLAVLGATQGC
jgi:DGQHR domain-containing protein